MLAFWVLKSPCECKKVVSDRLGEIDFFFFTDIQNTGKFTYFKP